MLLLGGCGGSGDDGGGTPPPANSVTISGRITFDRIPFSTTGTGLNPAAPVESPAKQVTVEALDASGGDAILATTATDDSGNYSLQVPANRTVKIRAKAEMVKVGTAPTWNFRVLNNTNGNALYALDGDAASSGTASSTRNLRATSGWGGSSYTATRAAAPFAILDTVFSSKQLVLAAKNSTSFPPLDVYWSPENRPAGGCTTNGNIGTTFYTTGATIADDVNCTPAAALPAGIYVLGNFGSNGDTDEFDQHVIAHEFGHYIEHEFSRSDSIGGTHGGLDRLDLRVAFGEGWGNAYSGMVLKDPIYRDSAGGVSTETRFNMENDAASPEGWYAEFSVGEILWDLFDGTNDGADTIEMGFGPIYSVMTDEQRNTEAMTSIFSFATALKADNPASTAGINALLTGESISGTDAFGTGESNDGGIAAALPVYETISVGDTVQVCSRNGDSSRNKLGFRRLLRMNMPSSGARSISVTGPADSDPDIYVYRNGSIVAVSDGSDPGSELLPAEVFAAGLHIIEVYDYNIPVAGSCLNVSVSGT